MAKRKSGGYRAPKHYLPRDGKPSKRRPGSSSDGAGGQRPGRGGNSSARPGAGERAGSSGDPERREQRERRDQRDRDANAGRRQKRTHPTRQGESRIRDTSDRDRDRDRDRGRGRPGAPNRDGGKPAIRVGSVVEPPRPPRETFDDVVPERLQAQAISPDATEGLTFARLGLGQRIVESLEAQGAATPFPIQAATIPDALAGSNVLGRARTGSGKTIAFGAAMVERLLVTRPQAERGKERVVGRPPRGLIMAPTRELALQIDRTVQPIARSVGMFTTQVYGGVPQQRQVGALRRGVDIVIGTPGRIEDLQRQGHLDLAKVEITVLDEADLMCDLGFLEAMQRVLRSVRREGQRMLFSATLDRAVMRLVDEFLDEPAVHEVAGESADHADLEHRVLIVDRGDRSAVLAQLAGSGGRVLVFTRTKLGAERVVEELGDHGVRAFPLHGDLSQVRRSRNLEQFSAGRADVLVATDVAARGIHVDDVRLVIQADAPDAFKTYLHRAGRTGRAGNRGTVVTLIPPGRRERLLALLERAGIDAPMIPARPGGPELDEFGQ